jgi:hypothetical protein
MVLNIFKVRYEWYDGDSGETLLAREATKEQFEKDLSQAKEFAENLKGIADGPILGSGYSTECLPEYYSKIIWFLLEKKGYSECQYNESVDYYVDDHSETSIGIQKRIKKTEWEKMNGSA